MNLCKEDREREKSFGSLVARVPTQLAKVSIVRFQDLSIKRPVVGNVLNMQWIRDNH